MEKNKDISSLFKHSITVLKFCAIQKFFNYSFCSSVKYKIFSIITFIFAFMFAFMVSWAIYRAVYALFLDCLEIMLAKYMHSSYLVRMFLVIYKEKILVIKLCIIWQKIYLSLTIVLIIFLQKTYSIFTFHYF